MRVTGWIERLEAELAEAQRQAAVERNMRREYRDRIDDLSAELAEWQRHGVRVTEDCEACGGTGVGYSHDSTHDCDFCGGTGKQLRDGVNITDKVWSEHSGERWYEHVTFPVEWLEATNECRHDPGGYCVHDTEEWGHR